MTESRHNLIKYILLILTTISCLLYPLTVTAADSKTGSLELVCDYDGVNLNGIEWDIFRVGTHSPYGDMYLDGDFADYPVSFDDLSASAINSVAETLEMYTKTDSIAPISTLTTDENGVALFENLETGIYLLSGTSVKIGLNTYTPDAFLIEIDEDTEETFNITSYPKFSVESEPMIDESEYAVEKMWVNDNGMGDRPNAVTIEIYADSVLYDTVVLDESNNWSHSWLGDTACEWSVKELNIDKNYTVSYDKTGTQYAIVNTRTSSTTTTVTTTPPPSEDIPQTGLLWWPVPLLALAGIAFIVVGIRVSAKRK